MPYCRNCHKEISKFDNDVCPYCGTRKPIDPAYKTMDVTTNIAKLAADGYELPKTRSQKAFCYLCMFLGCFGVHYFYIYLPKRGVLDLFCTLVCVLGIGLPLTLTGVFVSAFAFLIPFFVLFLLHVGLGFYFFSVQSPKDGKGDFLR